MQGTTARWADQGTSSFQLGAGPSRKDSFPRLEGLIRYACESMNVSPQQRYAQENMDAQAAVCDEIISKGIETNAAFHAVYMIVQKYINGAVLENARRALQLLDSCVKNCGDACHLAVSEKEFLNEIVRRFGPTPPPKNIIQQDILKLIETWNRTIAKKSFVKDDLGYIRDMHRLLVNKGFVFPEPDSDDINALNGLEVKGLQTEDALKERRNLALKAKLQAYLRRGGNRNLQEANKIIKILSDYDQSDKAEIRQEAADRIQDVRERARLLTERLKSFKPGDHITSGDAFESLVDDLKSEQHKLHNTLQNDKESEDSMSVLLSVNEEINRVIEWYDSLKVGDLEEAARLSSGGVAKGGLTRPSNTATTGAGSLSLIDFDDTQASQVHSTSEPALEGDLLGLSLGNEEPSLSSQGIDNMSRSQTNQIPPGFPQAVPTAAPVPYGSTSPKGQKQEGLPRASVTSSPRPNYDLLGGSFSSATKSNPASTQSTKSSLNQTSSPQLLSLPGPHRPMPDNDPFAAIASSARASSRPSSTNPSRPQSLGGQNFSGPSPKSLLDDKPSVPLQADSQSVGGPSTNDEDWDFSGAPPPEEEDFVVFNEDLKIEFQVSRVSDSSLSVTAVFSNNTSSPVSKLEFLTGMPKMYPRKIDPISSSRLQPHQTHGAYQRFTVEGVPKGQAANVPKIKWRLSRTVKDIHRQDQGEAQNLSIS